VIFDLDGLLLNTEPIYWQAANEICSRYGKHYSDEIVCQVIGKQESLGARIIVETLSLPLTPEEFMRERDIKVEELFPSSEPMTGARAITEAVRRKGLPTAVATSSNATAVRLKLTKHLDWFSYCFDFHPDQIKEVEEKKKNGLLNLDKSKEIEGEIPTRKVICGDEVKNAKPAPDIYLEAARRLRVSPENCLVFEDAPGGVAAAKAAGMTCVAVPPTTFKIDRAFYTSADLILPSLEHFDMKLLD